MQISILPPSRSRSVSFPTKFALQQDLWNDYNFQTQYHLHYRRRENGGDVFSLIGAVKILRRGQTAADGLQITGPFAQLSPDFCSVGVRLDYYARLRELPAADQDKILHALNDVVIDPALQKEFRKEPGWSTSLFRDNPDPDAYLVDASAVLSGDFDKLAEPETEIEFQPAGWSEPVVLNFDSDLVGSVDPDWGFITPHTETQLPRRIIVIIGRNGSGKSTLLSRIARVAHASPTERGSDEFRQIGSIKPSSVAFTRVVAISYSAFDSFIVPGMSRHELMQFTQDTAQGGGRYIYAGLRDLAREAREDVEASDTNEESLERADVILDADRRSTTRLKSSSQLTTEFGRLVQQIRRNGDEALLDLALGPILRDPSFADFEAITAEDLLGDNPEVTFDRWSTGHKIVMHVTASLVAHVKHRSLVLFDEPEMHLHPPLIAALMHAVRLVLEKRNALALVATHSPVVLQETLARHVRVVSRTGDRFDVSLPKHETFGENVGVLTYDTFQLTAQTTDFHRVLDRLIATYDTVESIDSLFTPGLSVQALAYVISGIAKKARGT